jgi:CBS domain-containing protein
VNALLARLRVGEVMTSGRLVGIVTATDLLRAFVGAFTQPIG